MTDNPSDTVVVNKDNQWSILLQRIVDASDEKAFEQLFEHFAPLVKGYCISNITTLGAHEAEELMQEVMCKVWLNAKSFNPEKSSASTWIYTVTRNTKIDYLRKASRREINYEDTQWLIESDDVWMDVEQNQPYVYLTQVREKAEIKQVMSRLPEDQQVCLRSMYLDSKTHSQIANELNLPLGTVKSRIRLGLKKLQTLMTKDGRN